MLRLDTTTRSLEFKIGTTVTTNQLTFMSCYVDHTSSTFTPGNQNGASNNTTAVTIVSAPSASTQRSVDYINIRNRDTVAQTVTVQLNDNTTIRELLVVTLNVNDSLTFSEADGWNVITTSGQKKSTVDHGRTLKTVSNSLTADTDVIAAVTGKRLKVIAYSLISSGTNANLILFKSNGTGGTEVWRVLLQSSANIAAGANLATEAPSFLFATNAGEKLTMDVNQTDTVHYSITYFDDDPS